MLVDGRSLPPAEVDRTEVLIVGAGAVGLALGITLARAGRRVTILEAGGERAPADYTRLNRGTVVGKPHLGTREGRMKALGGTTRLWGGQLVAFDAADFAGDPAAGRPRWPIDDAEMQPWFAAAFAFLGVDASGTDQEEIWRRATGLPAAFGEHLRLGMNVWLPQADFSRLFADDIRTNPRLRIVTEAEVEALTLDDGGRRVELVEARLGDGSRRRFAAPVVVLANGTLEIVRLLLRTAATAPDCAFAGNARIGRGFIDHLHGIAGRVEVRDAAALRRFFDNIYWQGRKYGVKIRATERFRASHRIANSAASLVATASIGTLVRDVAALGRRLLQGDGGGLFRTLGEATRMTGILLPMAWRYLVARRSTSLLSRGVLLGIEIEQLPTPGSYLALDPAFPPAEAPIAVHWQLDGREVESAAAVCEAVAAEFGAQGLGEIMLDPRLVARDPTFLDDCHDAFHQMGGACMADDPAGGVVDPTLKVFGTDNLYVLGAAAFPSGSFANPTLTAIALAMRLADHLAQKEPAPRC